MDKFRLNQVQSLLRKAGKSTSVKEKLKLPKEGKINLELFEKVINDMIDAEEFIYSSRPSHKLNEEGAMKFCNKILSAREKIDGILAEFGVIEKKNIEEEVRKLSQNFLFLTSKSNFKKIITNFGVESQNIIVTGVPLDVADMKIINPKIPEEGLESIKKKIKHVRNDINRKMDNLKLKAIIAVVENDKAGKILGERAKELYDASVIMVESLKDTSSDEFMSLISKL